jgi:hypothetical protein
VENDTGEDRIRQVLTDYQSGKFNKYEAMDALDLNHVDELLDLLAQYGVGPALSRDYFQSDPSAKPVQDFFTEGD